MLAILGGAASMSVWLKVSSLAGERTVHSGRVTGVLVASALVLGALMSVAGQLAWGAVGPVIVSRLGAAARPRDLRLVWGASFFPQVFTLLLLLPLDLMVVGFQSFASDPLTDSVSTAWAALSIALALALTVWSVWLFLRGVQAATGLSLPRAALPALGAAAMLGLVVTAVVAVGNAVIAGTSL